MSIGHGSYIDVPRRPPTSQEGAWINEIVLANPAWSDVDLGELFIVAECRCGCRSVVLEAPSQPQNPRFVGHQGLVGEIELGISLDGKNDVISVLLHFAEGSLSLLEVIWYNFPEPVPSTWKEINREVRIGG
jgi:hypothetical protein